MITCIINSDKQNLKTKICEKGRTGLKPKHHHHKSSLLAHGSPVLDFFPKVLEVIVSEAT